jgi:hypothetical protein
LTGNPSTTQQTTLRLVREDEWAPSELVAFCGHCGAHPQGPTESRVCSDCGLGLILEADVAAAPNPGDAFLVFDSYLCVCAVSREAERLLAMTEMELVNRNLAEVLAPADAEAQSAGSLATALMWAASGDHASRRVHVRPAGTFGVRLSAQIAACRPASAALVVLR